MVENVKGAQPWVGRAKWHYGSYYLWGDVPALMPSTLRTVKVDGFNFHQHEKNGKGGSFQSAAVAATESGHSSNPVNGTKGFVTGLGKGHDWRQDPSGRFNSKSSARKAASAQIAKIPLPLAEHIARVYHPRNS